MEILSAEFFSALLAIVIIDLVLAGDNAIAIALAARALQPQLRTRAVLWGTAGAMKTIIIADALMGLDNVLAVAGAAKGSFLLVVLGLLISIPIVVWGSALDLGQADSGGRSIIEKGQSRVGTSSMHRRIFAAIIAAAVFTLPAGAADDESSIQYSRSDSLELPGLTAGCHICEWRPKLNQKPAAEQCGTDDSGAARVGLFECGFTEDCERLCNFLRCGTAN